MSLYPTLEDLKVDQMQQAQYHVAQQAHAAATGQPALPSSGSNSQLYPSLDDYMGLDLANALAVAQCSQGQVAVPEASQSGGYMMVAPVSGGGAMGMARAEIKQGIRQMVLCKDQEGKMGLRVRAVSKGVFVALVYTGSPAALAGLRFGDQILEINNQACAGWDTDKTMSELKKTPINGIRLSVRDRPFERTVTMNKDSTGHVGFLFKNGKITALVKDSSAARNGLLIDHQLVEINGQNVVGLKDNDTGKIIEQCGTTITVTVMPCFVYDHIVKCMGNSLVRKFMDHSIPDL